MKRAVKKPCPACGGNGYRDRPDLRAVDATCSACGWHYTSHPRAPKRRTSGAGTR